MIDLAGLDLRQDAVDRQLVPVEALDRLVDLDLARQQCPDLHSRTDEGAHLIHGDDVERIRRRHGEPPRLGVAGDRQDTVAPGNLPRHQLHDVAVDQGLGEIDTVVSEHPASMSRTTPSVTNPNRTRMRPTGS